MSTSEARQLPTVIVKRWTGKVEETYTYRYLNGCRLKTAMMPCWSTGVN